MNTIYDYLDWRGDIPFSVSPFNEIDAAILARFSYEPFEGIVSSSVHRALSLEKTAFHLLNNPELESRVIDSEYDIKFVQSLLDSKRFKHVKLSGFINKIDHDMQTQFSAVVFNLGEGDYYVAFRGTDNTLVAWKEDFNMGFEFPVPAQEMALEYFEKTTAAIKEGTFIVGGHSKGGNLAIYASAFCNENAQKQIASVYNFDGPGFTEDLMKKKSFKAIQKKIKSFVPEFSIVGMLLEHMKDYKVVKSCNTGIGQHELLSWEVTKSGFVTIEEVDKSSQFFDNTFKGWIKRLTHEEREQFVDTVYNVLTGGNEMTLSDFNDNKFDSMLAVVKNYAGLEDETRKNVVGALREFVKSAGNVLKK